MSNNKAGLIHYSCFRFLKYFYVIIIFFLISWDFILYSSVCTTLLLFKDRVLPAYCW